MKKCMFRAVAKTRPLKHIPQINGRFECKRTNLQEFSHMPDFVNFNKRSISLPTGCKDLLDVLRPKKPKTFLDSLWEKDGKKMAEWMHQVKQSPPIRIKIPATEIAKYVAMVLDSKATNASLLIMPLDNSTFFRFDKNELTETLFEASILVETETQQKTLLAEYCKKHGLKGLEDLDVSHPFYPSFPTVWYHKIEPLPLDTPSISRIAMDLLGELGRTANAVEFGICYQEQTYPPELVALFKS